MAVVIPKEIVDEACGISNIVDLNVRKDEPLRENELGPLIGIKTKVLMSNLNGSSKPSRWTMI